MNRIRTTLAFVLIALLAIALCGCSPHRLLMSAVANRNIGTVKLLLKGGADPNSTEQGLTALTIAALVRSPEISQLLIDNGADVNGIDQGGLTALHHIAGMGDCASINVLVLNGAQVDAVDRFGLTPLMWSVQKGNADVVKCLIGHGAGVNRQPRGGLTPLMKAVWSDDPAIVQLLLDAGADPSLQTDCGDIAEDVVADIVSAGIKNKHTDEIQRLLQDRQSGKTESASPFRKSLDDCSCSE
jgi:ankyrin repeat protein